jgi:hypothetical protein
MKKFFNAVITFAVELETIILLFLRSALKPSRKSWGLSQKKFKG